MSDVISQTKALRLQLLIISGGGPGDRLWEIRELPSGRQTWIPTAQLDKATVAIHAKAAAGDTYIGALPRLQQSGTAAAVAPAWTLWVDIDGREGLERLARFRPLPAIVIRSGSDGCAHAWWPLRRPMKPEWVPRANRRLALALAGDPVSTDAARIMRPAGTLNWKHSPPRPVVCTRLEAHVFTFDQVVGGLPDPASASRPPRRPPPPSTTDPHARLAPLVRTVRDAPEGTRNARLFWAACRAFEHVDTGDLDAGDVDEELRDAALLTGLPAPEIDRTLQSARAASRSAAA